MTRRKPPKHEATEDAGSYLDRIKANELARFVKAADSLDNSDERRLRVVADKDLQAKLRAKYSHYLEILEHLLRTDRGGQGSTRSTYSSVPA